MSATESAAKRDQPLLVTLTAAWHLLFSLALLGGAVWIGLGLVEAVQGTVRWIVAAVAAALAAVQLYLLPRLWRRHASGRMMSLAVNYIGLGYSVFFMFRNATMTAALGHTYTSAERQAAAAAALPAVVVFGFFVWAMWNRRTAKEFEETIAQRDALTAYLYISPYLFLASIFTVTIVAYAVWLSLHQSAIFDVPTYVGMSNYVEALKDKDFHRALYNVLWYVGFVVTLQTSFAILLAVILNARFRGRQFFRTMFYAPSVTSSIVISLIFLWLYQKRGFLNYFFTRIGLDRLFLAAGIKAQPNWLNTATGFLEIFWSIRKCWAHSVRRARGTPAPWRSCWAPSYSSSLSSSADTSSAALSSTRRVQNGCDRDDGNYRGALEAAGSARWGLYWPDLALSGPHWHRRCVRHAVHPGILRQLQDEPRDPILPPEVDPGGVAVR